MMRSPAFYEIAAREPLLTRTLLPIATASSCDWESVRNEPSSMRTVTR